MKNMLKPIFTSLIYCSAALTFPAFGEDLIDIYKQALTNDPTYQAARYDHMAVLELRPQAKATLRPQVDLSANAAWNEIENDTMSVFDSQGYSLTLVQALYNQPAFAAVNQVDLAIAQSEAALESALNSLMLRASEAYFNIISAHDELEFAVSELNAIERQLEQAEKRFEVGLSAVTDVKEAQARYDLAVAQKIAATNRLAQAEEALKTLTNQDYQKLSPLKEDMSFLPPNPEDINYWVALAEKNNRRYLSAQYATQSAEEEIKLQKGFHYPTLSLVGSHSDTQSDNPLVESRRTALMLQLDVELYSGGSTSSKVREAEAKLMAAQRNQELQRRLVLQQTRNAYLGVIADISRVKALKQALISTQAGADATQAGFDVGTRTAVEVLVALRETFRAQADYSKARYAYILNSLRLKEGAGSLTAADLEEINTWLQ
ncbi:MAG TPA: type I secretion protein TolC [Gammaproteobacteria bacterium]|nr:type I secretion protein TolC [Gammaproteobacteria bacterium]HCO60309.1 type I secretion protein TolC [Porticoccaceae bacterium]